MPIEWPEMIANAAVGLYMTPRQVMQMTVAELDVLSYHKPATDKKKSVIGLLDPEQMALQRQLEYMQLTPQEKLAKRIKERG